MQKVKLIQLDWFFYLDNVLPPFYSVYRHNQDYLITCNFNSVEILLKGS